MYIVIVEFIIITFSVYVSDIFMPLYAIIIFDLVYDDMYIEIAFVAFALLYFPTNNKVNLLVFYAIACIVAYLLRQMKIKEKSYRKTIDSERRLRYELEITKVKLLNSSREAVHIAEIKERNRIARNIHDNIGHSIAGIFMQLQVVEKLYGKDDDKAREMLRKSINGLSDSLNVVRDTVHNIKPKENLGIEYVSRVIEDFQFTRVEFKHSGDINMVSPQHMELVATNIKEALTNSSKYSKATKMNISLDISHKYIRLLIKDNGVGCSKFKEGLGISGMKERISNVGGSISISGEDGFLIVCVIPIDSQGGKIFETTNS
jgi:signal transduction histidine kinase